MNPELRRNLWMEFSLHRLIGMPLVLALLFALFASLKVDRWQEAVFGTALWMFVLLAHFWGTRQASCAVTDEVRDRTWDWQRLSALSPWQMTWGKLFGATAFTWYGAAICLVLIVAMGPERVDVTWIAVALVGSAVALHAAAIAGSLQASRKDSRLGHRMGAIVMIPIAVVLVSAITSRWWQDGGEEFTWYGTRWGRLRFGALSAVVFAAWAVLGAYREMQRELKVRALPWAIPAFIVFVAAYVAGFTPPPGFKTATLFFFTGLGASLTLMYYSLFADTTTFMVARRIATHAAAGNWQRVLEELPLWVAPLILAAAFSILVAQAATPEIGEARLRSVGLYAVAFVLFAARDAGLMVFFALSVKPRRVEAAALLYMVLLWWVVPALLTAMGAKAIASFLLPFGADMNGWQAAAIATLHAAIAWGLVAWRWHRAQESFRQL